MDFGTDQTKNTEVDPNRPNLLGDGELGEGLGHGVLDAVLGAAVTLADGTLDLVNSGGEGLILVGTNVEVNRGGVLARGSIDEEGRVTEGLTTVRLGRDDEDGSSGGTRVVQHLEAHVDGNEVT